MISNAPIANFNVPTGREVTGFHGTAQIAGRKAEVTLKSLTAHQVNEVVKADEFVFHATQDTQFAKFSNPQIDKCREMRLSL